MKMRIIVFVFAVLTVNVFAEAPAATSTNNQPAATSNANHTAIPTAATNISMPAAPVFGESQPPYRPAVNPCQPGQGAQSFNSALGIGLGY